MKTTVALIFFAVSAFAQLAPPQSSPQPACGAVGVSFDAATSSPFEPPSKPESGKAMVYVVEDTPWSAEAIGAPTIKVGVDGDWVGATRGRSHLYFTVDPGEHHLCINWQSHGRRSRSSSLLLTSLQSQERHTIFGREPPITVVRRCT